MSDLPDEIYINVPVDGVLSGNNATYRRADRTPSNTAPDLSNLATGLIPAEFIDPPASNTAIDDEVCDSTSVRHNWVTVHETFRSYERCTHCGARKNTLAAEKNTAIADTLRQQAEMWAQEARTHKATVHEIYQLISGGKGEPGNWHGAQPVRDYLTARATEAGEILKRTSFLESQHDVFDFLTRIARGGAT